MFCKEVDDSVFKPTMDLFELLIDGPRMLLSLKTWSKNMIKTCKNITEDLITYISIHFLLLVNQLISFRT